MYTPKPIDTSNVELPEELLALTEKIAENVHEVWATGRIAEGWTYGDKKDTELKKTPCLVPYDDLPDSEKAFDRNTAFETLKLITKLGYKIVAPKSGESFVPKRKAPATDSHHMTVSLVGPAGSGKTTFLSALVDEDIGAVILEESIDYISGTQFPVSYDIHSRTTLMMTAVVATFTDSSAANRACESVAGNVYKAEVTDNKVRFVCSDSASFEKVFLTLHGSTLSREVLDVVIHIGASEFLDDVMLKRGFTEIEVRDSTGFCDKFAPSELSRLVEVDACLLFESPTYVPLGENESVYQALVTEIACNVPIHVVNQSYVLGQKYAKSYVNNYESETGMNSEYLQKLLREDVYNHAKTLSKVLPVVDADMYNNSSIADLWDSARQAFASILTKDHKRVTSYKGTTLDVNVIQ